MFFLMAKKSKFGRPVLSEQERISFLVHLEKDYWEKMETLVEDFREKNDGRKLGAKKDYLKNLIDAAWSEREAFISPETNDLFAKNVDVNDGKTLPHATGREIFDGAEDSIQALIIANGELTDKNEELERDVKRLGAEIRRQAQIQLEKANIKYTPLLNR